MRLTRSTHLTASRARASSQLSLPIPAELLDVIVDRVAELVLERLQPEAMSPYLNVDEAAEYLRCDKQRIYDLCSSRRLTKLKDGSRVLVLRQELDELVARALPPAARSRIGSGVAA